MFGAALISGLTLLMGAILMAVKRRQAALNIRDERYLYNSLRANRWAVAVLLIVLVLSPMAWNLVVMRSGLWNSAEDYWLSFADVQALALIAVMFLFGIYLIANYVVFKLLDKNS